MAADRLSVLDVSFLAAETPTAHMHVGWAAVFEPPTEGAGPSFEALREHVARRLPRCRRYRQRLVSVPFDLHNPVWVDDERFDLDRHVFEVECGSLGELVDQAMSAALVPARPLWELWIAPRLPDGRIAVVGKAHHCMVDGLAAVELAGLLLDPQAQPGPIEPEPWQPQPAPGWVSLTAGALADRAREQLAVARWPARLLTSPGRWSQLTKEAWRSASVLTEAFATPAPASPLNDSISSLRHLALASRPLDDLQAIKSQHGATINDVVLAACAGALRAFMRDRGDPPVPLKAMVPVSVREADRGSQLGNRIVFMFLALPCDQADPVARLLAVNRATRQRKQAGAPAGAQTIYSLVSHTPHAVQRRVTRLMASRKTFNLVVSNIPGPSVPLYMHGCRLAEAYPVVPLADRHALSIGVTTVMGRACFGLYADRRALPDADDLARALEREIDELRQASARPASVSSPPVSVDD